MDEEYRLVSDYFDVKKVLGEGSWGKVFKATVKEPASDELNLPVGYVVALKMIEEEKLDMAQDFRDNLDAEIELMRRMSRKCEKYTVKYYGTGRFKTINKKYFTIVMEYLEGFQISDFIDSVKDSNFGPYDPTTEVSVGQIAFITRQLLEGMTCMHSQGIVHRDIKAENVMYLTKEKTVKYIDYGFSCISGMESPIPCPKQLTGTFVLSSPEAFKISYRTEPDKFMESLKPTDCYQLGIVLHEFLFGELPYDIDLPDKEIAKIVSSSSEFSVPTFEPEPNFSEIMKMLLRKNYRERWTAENSLAFLNQFYKN